MIVPKAMLLISPLTMSRRTSTSSTRRRYNDNPMSSVKWTKMPPARIPRCIGRDGQAGQHDHHGDVLGGLAGTPPGRAPSSATRRPPRSPPWFRSQPKTTEPDRPTTTIAVISGPNCARYADRDQVDDELHGAEPTHLRASLQRHDQPRTGGDQANDRQRVDTHHRHLPDGRLPTRLAAGDRIGTPRRDHPAVKLDREAADVLDSFDCALADGCERWTWLC